MRLKVGQKLTQPHLLITKFLGFYQTRDLYQINESYTPLSNDGVNETTIITFDSNETKYPTPHSNHQENILRLPLDCVEHTTSAF